MNHEQLVFLAVLTPAMGATLMWSFERWPNVRDGISLASAALLFALVVSMYPEVVNGIRLAAYWGAVLPGLELGFVVEPLGLMFALVSSLLWLITTIYSIGYMRGQNAANQTRFFIFFAGIRHSDSARCGAGSWSGEIGQAGRMRCGKLTGRDLTNLSRLILPTSRAPSY